MAEDVNLHLDIDEIGLRGSGRKVARVAVVRAHGYTRDGAAPTITSDCANYRALELEVGRLKGELDGALAGALEHFESTRREETEAMAQRRRSAAGTSGDKPHLEAELTVRDVMTRDVKTLNRNDELSMAEELMKLGRFRHVVALDEEGKVAGVVSHRDIFFSALAWSTGQGKFAHDNALKTLPVKQVMQTDPQLISPETKLAEAAALMMDQKIGCLPVVDGEELVGIITEGDFLALLAQA
ncbi:MAG: CBS domain-containing protein [Gammaproteobacteria bacterium]